MSEVFKYNSEIDNKVKIAVAETLGMSVVSVSKIQEGEVNHVYKINTDKGEFIARIFSSPDWPEIKALELIDKKLTKKNILHADIIYSDKSSKYFPNGFVVDKFVGGKIGWKAIKDGNISFEDFHIRLAKVLKEVHSINFPEYGYIANGIGTSKDFFEHEINELKENLGKLKETDVLPEGISKLIEDKIRSLYNPIRKKFSPVLTHGDPSPANCIWTPNNEVVLVDWDNAMSSIWIRDLAIQTYWGSHLTYLGSLEERRTKLIDAFIRGHRDMGLTQKEVEDAEKIIHIIYSVSLLPYYYLKQQNMDAYAQARNRLMRDLG